jgi:Ca2+/H+ antiporter
LPIVLLAKQLAKLLDYGIARTTVLEGTVHLVIFCVYIVLIFSP